MKTQLIPLKSHDDLISVRDRMSWAKTPRILLVWPKSMDVYLRPLDLKVLQRHATSLGAQLGLVTRHRNIRREAQALRIPVFSSTGEAQRSPWPERDLHKKREWHGPSQDLRFLRQQAQVDEGAWRNHPLTRVIFFTAGVLAVLAIASLFIPRAQILLEAETQTQTVTLPVQADPAITTVFITGKIPAKELRVIVNGSLEKLATGEIPVPQTSAKGVVTFRNLTENEVSIPLGSVLTSTGLPGVRFLTTEQGVLPGGLKATLDIPVQAENAGAAGNVEAETILAIEGKLGLLVAVSNEEPTSGGRDRMEKAATEDDLARLKNDLLDELEKQALQEMEAILNTGDQFFSTTLDVEKILSETYDPPQGQPSLKVRLDMSVEFTSLYASKDDLTELASTVLNTSKPDGYVSRNLPLVFDSLGTGKTNSDGVITWTVRVSRELEKQVDLDKIVFYVQGRSIDNAKMRLENFSESATPLVIRVTPEWWPWMPLNPLNITVKTQ